MKKFFLYASMFAMTLGAATITSCSSDDSTSPSPVQIAVSKLLEVNGAEVKNGSMPAASTTAEQLGIGVHSNTSALAGGANIITVQSPVELKKFFVQVEGIDGYIEVKSQLATRAESTAEIFEYVVEVMYGLAITEDMTLQVNAQTADGRVAELVNQAVKYVESVKGDLAINLVFDQDKDVDLHLVMPDSTRIYYGNRTIAAEDIWAEEYERRVEEETKKLCDRYGVRYENGEINESDLESLGHEKLSQFYSDLQTKLNDIREELESVELPESCGLDHDSNAGCYIDHLNNENIVIDASLLIPGTYTVQVNMYSNCSPREKETKYTVMARLGDDYITVKTGQNPYSDKFDVDAYSNNNDIPEKMTTAMTFELTQRQIDQLNANTRGTGIKLSRVHALPTDDMSFMKVLDGNAQKTFFRSFFRF